MDINCHLSGTHAEKFPAFCYRVPVRTAFVVQPDDYDVTPHMPFRERVDYNIRITENQDYDCTRTVQVWLLPNRHTQAQTERMVAQFSISAIYAHAPELPAMLEEIARSVLLAMA